MGFTQDFFPKEVRLSVCKSPKEREKKHQETNGCILHSLIRKKKLHHSQAHNELKRGKKSILLGRTIRCLPQREKNQCFSKKISSIEGPRRRPLVNRKFQKALILAFEVLIVQPPKHTFKIEIFSTFQLIVSHWKILVQGAPQAKAPREKSSRDKALLTKEPQAKALRVKHSGQTTSRSKPPLGKASCPWAKAPPNQSPQPHRDIQPYRLLSLSNNKK